MEIMKARLRRVVQTVITQTAFKGRVRLARTLASFLKPNENPTLCRMPNDLRMMLDLNDPMQTDIYYGLYETGLQRLVRALLAPGMIFFDLGAHVGFYTLAAAQRVGIHGAVYAFEPLATNFALLAASVAANHFTQVRLERVAVTDRVGAVTLHVPPRDAHNASGFATVMDFFPDAASETVPTISIDEYTQSRDIPRIDLLKMDIEAAEVLALRGMRKLLTRSRKPRILSEVNVTRLQDSGYAPTILYDMLAEYNYTAYRMGAHALVKTDSAQIAAPLENILFLSPADNLFEIATDSIPLERIKALR